MATDNLTAWAVSSEGAATLVATLREVTEAYWGVDNDDNGDGHGEPPLVIQQARAALSKAFGRPVPKEPDEDPNNTFRGDFSGFAENH